ncbi:MAG: protein-export chaperone SecB [Burkholderiales bacterium]|nr:protein-export chaperone SecB [Burkholderiales bacterium]
MTDQQPQQPVFSIEKVYVKDASVELPNAPAVFMESQTPQVEIHLASNVEKMNDTLFHVVLTVTATAKHADRTCFLVEVAQAGIFRIHGVPERDMDPILGIACPNILFPYARETVADLVGRAGFPPIHLAPVNFEAIYAQRLQQQEAHAATPLVQTAN